MTLVTFHYHTFKCTLCLLLYQTESNKIIYKASSSFIDQV